MCQVNTDELTQQMQGVADDLGANDSTAGLAALISDWILAVERLADAETDELEGLQKAIDRSVNNAKVYKPLLPDHDRLT